MKPLYLSTLAVLCVIFYLSVSGIPGLATSAIAADSSAAAIPATGDGVGSPTSEFAVAGPLRSFLRMAGISQQIAPEDVLPLLSWNVATLGYQGPDRRTEFLILLSRYVVQAKELSTLAGSDGLIRVTGCADAGQLLHILGYRIVSECGKPATSLLTGDAERAFLTIDSGFPLTDLEQTLQGGKPFEYKYPSTRVPVMFTESEWTTASKRNHKESSKDLVDTILNDRSVARLYWAMSKMDPETRDFLERNGGVRKLLPYGALLDFYGSHLSVRNGRVLVPGGRQAEAAWNDLVGEKADTPADFVPKLLSKDKGWLVAYFDVLSSIGGKQQTYFTEGQRLHRFYAALRAPSDSMSATTGVFRPAPWLLLLASQMRWDSNGQPLVPGGIDVWQEIFAKRKDILRAAHEKGQRTVVRNPEELLEAMFSLSRGGSDVGPLQAYLALSELDSRRPAGRRMSAETVRLMCDKFADFSDQYRVFSEFLELTDSSISLFLDVADQLGKISNPTRGNAYGMIQANIGIWQILARQGQIKSAQLDDSWQNIIKPFEKARTASQVYDAGRTALSQEFRAATGKTTVSQDELIELLAGPRQTTPEGQKVHTELANRMRSVLDGQRLVSLDTLLLLGDALNEKAQGKQPEEYVFHMADELHDFEMPQAIFTTNEREEWAARVYNNKHTDIQMKSNVGGILKSAKASHTQIEEARGQLTSFLRDTLVGMNYAYYEPPGAQALHNNPLFVRSHDFSAETVEGIKNVWQAPQLFGAGYPAGGGAHFVGSLADLPYSLAELEQDFIAPKNVQALIWKELVPSLMTSAVLPRWWNISPDELHAVTLYQRTGEELITASAHDEQLRGKVMSILSDRVLPRRTEQVEQAMRAGHVSDVLPKMTPADTFYLTAEFERRYPKENPTWGKASEELGVLRKEHPEQVNWERLSQDFGVPHPTLSHTYARELLNVPPLPAFSGYASRLLAESWDSSNLYWARLADETGYSPVALNRLVPELTEHMVEKTFATDLEDWPAILRAMRETGDDFRTGKIGTLNDGRPHP
jgi:hypothetical protein